MDSEPDAIEVGGGIFIPDLENYFHIEDVRDVMLGRLAQYI